MATSKKKPVGKTSLSDDVDQLRKDLDTKRQDLTTSIVAHRAGELVNPHIIKVYRREIARIKTKLNHVKRLGRKEGK